MKLCRLRQQRLGIVEGDEFLDVSKALGVIPLGRTGRSRRRSP